MIKIMEGGHYKEKGYYYALYLTFPKYTSTICKSITGSDQSIKKLDMNTGFSLTSNSIYSNILFSILGFSLGLEIHSRSENEY